MDRAATIFAPATPPGEGGIGIVRLSGPEAADCLAKVFRGSRPVAAMASHRLYHGRVLRPDGQPVDEVLAVIMRAPHSYTGEDVVELHCHGGTQVMRTLLDLLHTTGARLAAPGEFTLRAFLSGRLDLTQAEAVIDLIRARSERAGQIALGQLDGKLSRAIHAFDETLTGILALLEAHIDFPDDDLGSLDAAMVSARVAELHRQISTLAASFDAGRILRDGVSILILGRPNVGKSSLLNTLLGEARAIVTEVAGTTRDTIEEQLVLDGFPVRLIDTAGIRETIDPVEREGVARARAKREAADLVLLVVDGSRPLTDEDQQARQLCDPARTLVVLNKCDLGIVVNTSEFNGFAGVCEVSARHGEGLGALHEALVAFLTSGMAGERGDDLVVVERRHREALLGAAAGLERFLDQVACGTALECLALELREALAALGQITGETTPDEVLDQIFSRFCIGK